MQFLHQKLTKSHETSSTQPATRNICAHVVCNRMKIFEKFKFSLDTFSHASIQVTGTKFVASGKSFLKF